MDTIVAKHDPAYIELLTYKSIMVYNKLTLLGMTQHLDMITQHVGLLHMCKYIDDFAYMQLGDQLNGTIDQIESLADQLYPGYQWPEVTA